MKDMIDRGPNVSGFVLNAGARIVENNNLLFIIGSFNQGNHREKVLLVDDIELKFG